MSEESLRELLARLREHLHAGSSLDAAAREQLRAVTRDIEGVLAAADTQDAPPHGVAARLETLAVGFAAGHPALATTLRELMDALARAGI